MNLLFQIYFFIMLKIRTIKIDKLLNKNILYFFDPSNEIMFIERKN